MREEYKIKAMRSFIDAADELINEIGIENVTIRNIAKKAGYNSATIYNYFENLEHLVFLGAMKNIKDYALSINRFVADAENAMDRFLKVWECFCCYAFERPDLYNAICSPVLSKHIEDYVSEFYTLYPEDLGIHHETISTMLLKGNINDRGMTTAVDCVNEGYIEEKNAEKLNDMTILIFDGILKRVLKGSLSKEYALDKNMEYIKYIVKFFLIKDYNFYY